MEKTKDWVKYEKGLDYNRRLSPNYFSTTNTNIDFFNGDQWRNLQVKDMPKPVFNVIKRVITFFVASLTSANVKVNFTPLKYQQLEGTNELLGDDVSIAKFATAEMANLFEKFKMENRVRDACFDGAILGDLCGHLYFDAAKKPYGGAFADIMGEICFELVDGTNVFFGNPNNPSTDVNVQPYIIISGRDMTENLKDEAKRYKQSKQEINNIKSDSDYQHEAGEMSQIEIEGDSNGKSLYIIIYKYDKKTGTVKMSKCTESAYMYKDIDTGLSHYPIAWGNWTKQKNCYHGRAICTEIIPNQIFINRMFAMCMYNLMMTAFPKAIYDGDRIADWSNEIGEALRVNNLAHGESVKHVADYLDGGNMSSQITQVIELAINYTKECLGISEVAMGNTNIDVYKTIVAVQKANAVPLDNPKANLYEWIEQIATIALDMAATYYGTRPVVVKGNNESDVQEFDFSKLKNVWLNMKIDVGETAYWSELSSIQTLDNYLQMGLIDIVDHLEGIPDGYIHNKHELIEKLKGKMQMQQQGQFEQMAQFVDSLPPEIQAKLEQLRQTDPQGYEQQVINMMQQSTQS